MSPKRTKYEPPLVVSMGFVADVTGQTEGLCGYGDLPSGAQTSCETGQQVNPNTDPNICFSGGTAADACQVGTTASLCSLGLTVG